jgi:carbamoyl-phosphate synthase large subunit
MTSRLVVLVTGAGGVYGAATVDNLRRSSLSVETVAADTSWHASGLLRSKKAAVLPKVDDPSYVPRLISVVRESGAHAVFICSGQEIRSLVGRREELERETGATFILPDKALYTLASDKLETVRFLESKGFDSPATILSKGAGSLDDFIGRVGLPVIAKPRFGQGSRGLIVCRSADDLRRVQALDEEYVFQELLGDDDHEYTVGVMATDDGEVLGSIALRRWLSSGQTGACEVVDAPVITEYAEAIARELRPRGYLNVQLRLRRERPVAFEINARVSSSTGFRALAGFNEPELILRRYVLNENPARPRPAILAMVRSWKECVVEPSIWNARAPRE